jgi:hypothetical protein
LLECNLIADLLRKMEINYPISAIPKNYGGFFLSRHVDKSASPTAGR